MGLIYPLPCSTISRRFARRVLAVQEVLGQGTSCRKAVRCSDLSLARLCRKGTGFQAKDREVKSEPQNHPERKSRSDGAEAPLGEVTSEQLVEVLNHFRKPGHHPMRSWLPKQGWLEIAQQAGLIV